MELLEFACLSYLALLVSVFLRRTCIDINKLKAFELHIDVYLDLVHEDLSSQDVEYHKV